MTLQKPDQANLTKRLFLNFVRSKTKINVVTLCGDIVTGQVIEFDLMGFVLMGKDNVQHYFPKKNYQSINWR